MGGVSLDLVYPVGSIYIGLTETCPLEDLGIGEWEKLSEGKVLQTATGTQTLGEEVAAGLPNVTGALYSQFLCMSSERTGALSAPANWNTPRYGYTAGSSGFGSGISMNLSGGNSIYGKSNTVQPPAVLVNIWKRVA